MQYDKVITRLRQAEFELKKLLEVELSEVRYENARELLEYVAQVNALGESMLEGAEERETMRRAADGGQDKRLPRFFISDAGLVKLGRSKQPEIPYYRHEMPRENFDVLAEWLGATHGRPWSMAELLESMTLCEIPTYQSYLAIAALRRAQIVRPRSRGKYEVSPDAPQAKVWWIHMIGIWPNEDREEETPIGEDKMPQEDA